MTLLETLVVISTVAMLASLIAPAMTWAKRCAMRAGCAANVSQLGLATDFYMRDNGGRMFSMKDVKPGDGTYWWFGFESFTTPKGEGQRILDRTKARLFPYLHSPDSVEVCPGFPAESPQYKPKYRTNWTTYGVPLKLMSPTAPARLTQILSPGNTLMFVDCAQLNNFQAPASAANPMFEQWYYISRMEETVNYLHQETASAVMFDLSLRRLTPDRQAKINTSIADAPVGRPPADILIQTK